MVGVGTGPPNVLLAPKPTSSVRISRIFGAPLGALTSCGKSLVESPTVRPMCPLNVCSGRGSTSCDHAGSAKAAVSAKLAVASKVMRLIMLDSPLDFPRLQNSTIEKLTEPRQQDVAAATVSRRSTILIDTISFV